MTQQTHTQTSAPPAVIAVSQDARGLVLSVRGVLDDRGSDLLAEVVRAALLSVRRARWIHVDLRSAMLDARGVPRIVVRLAKAGATVTMPEQRAAAIDSHDATGSSAREQS